MLYKSRFSVRGPIPVDSANSGTAGPKTDGEIVLQKCQPFCTEIIWKNSIIILINIIPVNPLKNKSCVIANGDCPVTQEASDRKQASTIHYCYAARPVLTYLIRSYPAAADKRRYFHVSVVQQQ